MNNVSKLAKEITSSSAQSMREGLRLGQLEGLRKAKILIDLEIEKLQELSKWIVPYSKKTNMET